MADTSTQHGSSTLYSSHSVFQGEPDRSKKADNAGTRPTHILLVADAQVSMRTADSRTFSGLFNDVYMRRAWKITRRLRPHQVFFLGDMLKTGKSVVSDDE